MLFSLVLAVASKEVELWQAFDDFAPRQLMDLQQEEDQQDQPAFADDYDRDEIAAGGEEEGGLFGGMVLPAVGIVGALAVGAVLYNKGYFGKLGGKNKQNESIVDKMTWQHLKKGDVVTVTAAGGTAAAVLLTVAYLYQLQKDGGSSIAVEADLAGWKAYLTKKNVGIVGGGTAALGGIGLTGWYFKDYLPFVGKSVAQLKTDYDALEQQYTTADTEATEAENEFNTATTSLNDANKGSDEATKTAAKEALRKAKNRLDNAKKTDLTALGTKRDAAKQKYEDAKMKADK